MESNLLSFWSGTHVRRTARGAPPCALAPISRREIRTPATRISITHKITRYPSANCARRSAFSAKPSLDWPRPDMCSMLGARCSRWKSFLIAQQKQPRLGGKVALVWDLGGIGDRFIGVSPCLRLNTFTSKFTIALLNNAFGAGIWLALTCLGAVGIGAAILAPPSPRKSDAAIAPRDPVSRAETIPTASPVEYAAVDPRNQAANKTRGSLPQKPFCLGPSPSDGSCVVFQLPKVRMVRVPPRCWRRPAG